MMRIPLLAVGLFASVLPMKAAPPIDLSRLLECIAECEGGEANEPGGRVFCSYGVWADRAPHLAYQYSSNETVAWPIFMSHLVWLSEQLAKSKTAVTPQSLATAWRHGLSKAVRLKGRSEYGQRCANLFNDHKGFKP